MKINQKDLGMLVHLVEEAAEVQQVAMKIIRFGWDSYHPEDAFRHSNRKRLSYEIGNLIATIDGIVGIEERDVMDGKESKTISLHSCDLVHDQKLQDAIEECKPYNARGQLTESLLDEISQERGVSPYDILEYMN